METVTLHPSPEALPALQLRAEEPPRPTAKAHSAGPGDRPFPAPTRKPPRGGEAGRLRDHRVPAWSPAGPHPTPRQPAAHGAGRAPTDPQQRKDHDPASPARRSKWRRGRPAYIPRPARASAARDRRPGPRTCPRPRPHGRPAGERGRGAGRPVAEAAGAQPGSGVLPKAAAAESRAPVTESVNVERAARLMSKSSRVLQLHPPALTPPCSPLSLPALPLWTYPQSLAHLTNSAHSVPHSSSL
uniref:translation initiation factor IF-2-like isoform X2 n=1 Tax=Halichoerus grypus TaxID=9711 RepID=UPI00165964C5|nr:translation initiation factor IF-2-like isoform X2 [Halichoerus grypus]